LIKKRFTYKKVQKKSQYYIRAKSFFESDCRSRFLIGLQIRFFESSQQSTFMGFARAGLTIRLSMSLAHKQTKGQLRSGLHSCGRGYVFFDYNMSMFVVGGAALVRG
jgi:hypothetical protein